MDDYGGKVKIFHVLTRIPVASILKLLKEDISYDGN
jgi:hypothetical protein